MAQTIASAGSGIAKETSLVTYRHLLSKQSLTPTNPLRAIAHVDIDGAYAQFEMVRLGLSPETPVACQQWNSLIAINYPARAFGITRHLNVDEAKKKCPELVCVHVATYKEGEDEAGYWPDAKPETHKVSLEPFRRESLKILKIFSESCPTIEKASIDEAYLDFTVPVRELILERQPHLAAVPEDAPLGLDTPLPDPPTIDWTALGNIVPILSDDYDDGGEISQEQKDQKVDKPVAAPDKIQPSKSSASAWSDYALSIGAELVQKCRDDVRGQLGYTCSAGVSRNKILSKLCSAYRKPNAQTILRNEAVPGFLRPLKFQKIRSLGGKLGDVIAAEYEAATVGDLWKITLPELQSKLGVDVATWLYNVLRGIEHSEVTAKSDVKSMLSSKNFKPALTKQEDVNYWMRIVATDLHARLQEARSISADVWPKNIVFGARDEKYQTRHRQAAFPMTSNLSIDYITKAGDRLLKELLGERKGGLGKITNLSLSFSGLEKAEKGQQGISAFLGAGKKAAGEAEKRPSPQNSGGKGASSASASNSQPLSDKALGKRKAEASEDGPVDLTLDGSSDVEQGKTSSVSRSVVEESDDDDDLIEVEPTGPVYRCAVCNAVMSVKPANGESLEQATEGVAKRHSEWHEAQKAKKDAPPKKKKKKKGQTKLNGWFTRGDKADK